MRHLDTALGLGGQRTHDRRLNERDKRHVGIRSHCNGAEQMGCESPGDIDGGGAIGAADDTDGRCLREGEVHDAQRSQSQRTQQSGEDAELRRGAE